MMTKLMHKGDARRLIHGGIMSFQRVIEFLSSCGPGSRLARWSWVFFVCVGLEVVMVGRSWAGPIFGTPVSFEVGRAPVSVAMGDVSMDGKPDLVTANFGAGTVSVLLGNGDGTFQPKADFGTRGSPQCVAIGDVNGDGQPDLVTAEFYSDGSVSVLLGHGDGTFLSKVDYATGIEPSSVAIGDVNGDGKPDLVTGSLSEVSNTVSVLLGNGDGTFQPKVDYGAGFGPRWVAIGDVSGDGKSDLVVANVVDNTVSVLLGNGDGTFLTKVDYGAGIRPLSVAIGDVSGDGKSDLVATNGDDNTVSVLLGNGDGTFQAKVDYGTGINPASVAIGDVSGDGKPDVVAVNSVGSTASVLLGNGDGTFQAREDYPTGSTPFSLAIGDVSGEGKPDLVTTDGDAGSVSVFLNIGSTSHAPVITAPSGVSVDEGMALTSTISATDPDGDHVTLSMLPDAPMGATFLDNGDNTGTFSWTPDFSQAGSYSVTFRGTDGHGEAGTATTAITVKNVNRAPTANPGGPYNGAPGAAVAFDGSHSSDPDGDALTFAWSFGDGGTGSGATPSHTYSSTAGSPYSVSLTVSDGLLTGTATTTATVQDFFAAKAFYPFNLNYIFPQILPTWVWIEPINGSFADQRRRPLIGVDELQRGVDSDRVQEHCRRRQESQRSPGNQGLLRSK